MQHLRRAAVHSKPGQRKQRVINQGGTRRPQYCKNMEKAINPKGNGTKTFRVIPGTYGDKDQFKYNVQMWYTFASGTSSYSGQGRYCRDMGEVNEYIEANQ